MQDDPCSSTDSLLDGRKTKLWHNRLEQTTPTGIGRSSRDRGTRPFVGANFNYPFHQTHSRACTGRSRHHSRRIFHGKMGLDRDLRYVFLSHSHQTVANATSLGL
jgi:hypothetical protein